MYFQLWTEFLPAEKGKTNSNRKLLEFAFLSTRSGLTRFFDNSPTGESKNVSKDLRNYGELFLPDRYPLFYRRAASYKPGTYVYSPRKDQGYGNQSTVLVTRAWALGETLKNEAPENYASMLVSGYQLNVSYLEDVVKREMKSKYGPLN